MTKTDGYELAVWRYVCTKIGHPTSEGHGPSGYSDIEIDRAMSGCPTCGGWEEMRVEAGCLCGERLGFDPGSADLSAVIKGVLAAAVNDG